MFQSSPDLKVGCYADTVIEIGPEFIQFQSSPDLKVGCYPGVYEVETAAFGFQSSPDLKVGCYAAGDYCLCSPVLVSILTRPEGRMLRCACLASMCFWLAVSILTRPEGRMLPGRLSQPAASALFQSSPDLKVGCYGWFLPVRERVDRSFNPHPT